MSQDNRSMAVEPAAPVSSRATNGSPWWANSQEAWVDAMQSFLKDLACPIAVAVLAAAIGTGGLGWVLNLILNPQAVLLLQIFATASVARYTYLIATSSTENVTFDKSLFGLTTAGIAASLSLFLTTLYQLYTLGLSPFLVKNLLLSLGATFALPLLHLSLPGIRAILERRMPWIQRFSAVKGRPGEFTLVIAFVGLAFVLPSSAKLPSLAENVATMEREAVIEKIRKTEDVKTLLEEHKAAVTEVECATQRLSLVEKKLDHWKDQHRGVAPAPQP